MSRRASSSITEGGVNLGLIVTPMLDMSFQLLAFFIMVYSPNTGEEFIGADLTKQKSAPKDGATKGPPKGKDIVPSLPVIDIDPKLTQTLTIVLSVNNPEERGGAVAEAKESELGVEPKFIMIRSPATVLDKDKRSVINIAHLRLEDPPKDPFAELQKRLEDVYKELNPGKKKDEVKAEDGKGKEDAKAGEIVTKFRIEAEQDIQFAFLVQVYAACRNAGFEDVVFTSPLAE